ncbi:MAG: hypothetical protein WB626_03360 [Bacteroidota bacterium]
MRERITLLVLLLLAALGLYFYPEEEKTPPEPPPAVKMGLSEAVDTLLAGSGIPREKIRKRVVQAPRGEFSRVERRVSVPRWFASVRFNRGLAHAVEDMGGRVVATEATRQGTVTMHVIRGGLVVESITFAVDRKQTVPADSLIRYGEP